MDISLQNTIALPAPFPLAFARHVFAEDDLRRLRDAWPPESFFGTGEGPYVKHSLPPSNPAYPGILAISSWAAFAAAIRRPSLAESVRGWFASQQKPVGEIKSTWFEFTSMSTGGTLPPHTDAASKIVTMIIWMMAPEEWRPEWGGGLDVYDEHRHRLACYHYEWNSAILLVRTANSWHGISPLRCPPTARRKTITVCLQP